ncbi:MAG TPA: FkbM family methyltransferase [Candidatus Binataceae bacterium]|nr:FkbM family methyltransferase [Candidatus Binataceae bacterium]HVC43439.1 FkbM family methyltransferase [Candidatus Binataceae bacterium]
MKSGLLGRVAKPEYFFQPSQILKRLLFSRPSDLPEVVAKLPWGARISVKPNEVHGRAILRLGVIDLPVSEAIWRTLEIGDIAFDVGANIGYMTSIMAARIGVNGVVTAFEPHPAVFSRLEKNVQRWNRSGRMGHVDALNVAVSCSEAVGALRIPEGDDNEGLARLADGVSDGTIPVNMVTLDRFIDRRRQIGLLKVDVEGHEREVLSGAESLLRERRIRHIIFEEHRNYPTPVAEFLEQMGYAIYQLGMNFWGPILGRCGGTISTPRREWEPRSMLATCDQRHAELCFRPGGWFALQHRK